MEGRKAKRKEKKERKEWRDKGRNKEREAEVEGGQRLKPKLQLESNTKALKKNPVDLWGNPASLLPFSALLNYLLSPPFLTPQIHCLTQAVNRQRIAELKRVILQAPAASRHVHLDPKWNSCCTTWQGINLNSVLRIRGRAHPVPNLALSLVICLWLGDIPFSPALALIMWGLSLSSGNSKPSRKVPALAFIPPQLYS